MQQLLFCCIRKSLKHETYKPFPTRKKLHSQSYSEVNSQHICFSFMQGSSKVRTSKGLWHLRSSFHLNKRTQSPTWSHFIASSQSSPVLHATSEISVTRRQNIPSKIKSTGNCIISFISFKLLVFVGYLFLKMNLE